MLDFKPKICSNKHSSGGEKMNNRPDLTVVLNRIDQLPWGVFVNKKLTGFSKTCSVLEEGFLIRQLRQQVICN